MGGDTIGGRSFVLAPPLMLLLLYILCENHSDRSRSNCTTPRRRSEETWPQPPTTNKQPGKKDAHRRSISRRASDPFMVLPALAGVPAAESTPLFSPEQKENQVLIDSCTKYIHSTDKGVPVIRPTTPDTVNFVRSLASARGKQITRTPIDQSSIIIVL